MSVNTFIGSGNLTRDAETRFTQAGKECCFFTVAVSARKDEDPLFIRVTTWEKLAQQCARLKKGAPVLVQGSLKFSKWKGDDGKERQSLEMTSYTVEFLNRGEKREDVDPDATRQPGDAF